MSSTFDFQPRGKGEKPTGRWIAEEIGPGELGDDDYLVYLACATEVIAREIAVLATGENWRVEVYPERTVTGLPSGDFETVTDPRTGFEMLWQYDAKYGVAP